ncbi:sensor histidine kinase [Rufibacter sp. DG15C]|uniref:sensor histidine kinase n=1 Tax=Rufibacter sp. DG15C TaxID=1379909 RepID=UPI0009EA0C11|nr:sensor histidine kinase [Rufibacter sp. DG15C]
MKNRLPLMLHVLLWLGLIVFNIVYSNLQYSEMPWQWWAFDKAQTFLFHIGLFYFNWFLLVPKILAKDKVVLYAVAVLVSLAVFGAVRAPLELFEFKQLAAFDAELAKQLAKFPDRFTFFRIMLQLSIMGLMNIFLSSALKVTGDYLKNERLRKELEHQHMATELELLKAQVNPHFLFNTLNNIYSLAYQQAPNTPDAIMKLSLLLRYQLYETNTTLVPLEKEIEHLQNLLDLHRLRLTDPSLLSLEIKGDICTSFSIPPMLLMPLVENMFKHGLASAPMHLWLEVNGNTLTFTTSNSLKANSPSEVYGGLGLGNLRRRLALLYPHAHTFETKTVGQEFTATLTLSNLT